MGKFSTRISQTKKYYKRNGLKKTFYAVCERTFAKCDKSFFFVPASSEELEAQRKEKSDEDFLVSIVVPVFETDEVFFTELIDSVEAQTYSNWELILADAGPNKAETHRKIVEKYEDDRIKYFTLEENAGISANTNAAILHVNGAYTALLDHDDVLTPDALFYMVKAVKDRKDKKPIMVYSDEDKTDSELKSFYEPHRKRKLNLDLILSNNYICHFTMIESSLIRELKFRPEYDGAQDYDLFLRVIARNLSGDRIVHVPKILYHWRCHEASTASNTDSKTYAYDNGRKAVMDFCRELKWDVNVCETPHLGFHSIEYVPDIFTCRKNVGAVCGPVISFGKIISGALNEDGECLYGNLPKNYSGYMHRASLAQTVRCGDVRNMVVRDELKDIYELSVKDISFKDNEECIKASLKFSNLCKERGYILVYDPELKGGMK